MICKWFSTRETKNRGTREKEEDIEVRIQETTTGLTHGIMTIHLDQRNLSLIMKSSCYYT